MKILIFTEGGEKIGYGHMTRCIALAHGLKERLRGANIRFIINADNHAQKFLRKQKVEAVFMNWIRSIKKVLRVVERADVIVVDSYFASASFYSRLNSMKKYSRNCMTPYVVAIDDYYRIDYPADLVINPSICGDEISYKRLPSTKFLAGKDYIILRKEFRRAGRIPIRKSIRNVFVSFGGVVRPRFFNLFLMYFLREAQYLRYHVIRNSPVFIKHKSVRFYPNLNASRLIRLMRRCDIAISAGGQTLYESASIGMPTIAVCFAKNQMTNIPGLNEEGFLKHRFHYNEKGLFKKILKDMTALDNKKSRGSLSRIGRSLVDGRGVSRIACYLEKELNERKTISLRPADINDCRDIFRWRNDSAVRRWCFQKDNIHYSSHKEWFEKKLRDKDVKIYIAVDKKGRKIGQARLEKERQCMAYISVNLAPSFIGMGLGNRLISMATDVFKKESPSVKKVIAEIAEGNVASERSFQKAGYVFANSDFKEGVPMSVYERK